eukprot:CAMPEP_0172836492 /NCGR_PEP_ID=MMETSP1075-20121228/26516_1 /TAXON_ID=2916 /ORGANISM="Ceratium fusus, Strain PA161109" /LENGTH=314 /DNA_ID=CAMNT_0013679721 /DNA_START=90 /DNA_END=1031 /DNA_ORIENTATION=+
MQSPWEQGGHSDSDESSELEDRVSLSQQLLTTGKPVHYRSAYVQARKDVDKLKKGVETAQTKLEKLQAQSEESKEESWQELVNVLKDLNVLWEVVTPEDFVMNLVVLGHQAKEYLDLFSICLDSSKFWTWLSSDWRHGSGEGMKFAVLTHASSVDDDIFDYPDWWRALPYYDRCRSYRAYMQYVASGDASKEYLTYWSSTRALFAPQQVGDMIWIAKTLHNCGSYSDCLNSIVSRGILDNYWAQVFGGYMLRLALDVGFLFTLGLNIGWTMYHDWILDPKADHSKTGHQPLYWLVMVSGVLAIRTAVNPLFDMY